MRAPTQFSCGMLGLAALVCIPLSSYPQRGNAETCTHRLPGKDVLDIQYYDDNDYKIGKIKLKSPFGFFFLISQRLDSLKNSLPIHEGDDFSESAYNKAAKTLDEAVRNDSAFGETSRFKVVYSTANLTNCDEQANHKTVDIVYYVFSTDPIPTLHTKPEDRATSTEQSTPKVAERNTQGALKLVPLGGYNNSFHGFGGGESVIRLPAKRLEDFRFQGTGSSNTLFLNGELNGKLEPHKKALDTVDYHLAYHYEESPTQALSLKLGSGQFRFTGASQELGAAMGPQTKLRYGLSLEQGLQQSNVPSGVALTDTIANSRYGAIRLYTGITTSTRYSETIASYGLDIGGAGLGNLDYAKQIGDVSFSFRFPGCTHSPWDLQARATGGGISGGPVLLNDRFFGGNLVLPFIPGDSWLIPDGPLVRSITANYLNGTGYGGTSFYSTNITIGKVIKSRPLIPEEIENADGFSSGVEAAEDTAEGFFFDSKLASSQAMSDLVTKYQKSFGDNLEAFDKEFQNIPTSPPANPKLKKAVDAAERDIRLARLAIKSVDGMKLRQLYGNASAFVALKKDLPRVEALAPEPSRQQLKSLQANLEQHLRDLPMDIQDLEKSPEGQAAKAYAKEQMARPRQVIETLRYEANTLAVGPFAIFDTGRLWPDPNGTRYAFGGGVRLSVVNVNFSLGYAANPNPLHKLHQGDGAALLEISYTNLFW
jgi:hypothetical protein